MGRAALDEDAIRLIEEHNPEIEFDWTQILRGTPEPAEESGPDAAGPRQPSRRERGSRRRPEPGERSERAQGTPARDAAAAPAEAAEPPQFEEPAVEPLSLSATVDEYDATLAGGDPVPAGGVDDFEPAVSPPSAAAARLGSEGLLRLRARYAEVLARISERVADAVQQEQLKAQAERLNPDTWVTDQEVRDGLEQYEAVFDSLRAVVGRKRTRRRRRRGGGSSGSGSAGGENEQSSQSEAVAADVTNGASDADEL